MHLLCARAWATGSGWHRAQGTHSRPMQATDGHMTFRHPFDSHARLRLRSSTTRPPAIHRPQRRVLPTARIHFCIPITISTPTPAPTPAPTLLFASVAPPVCPSLASAPATLPRDPHHSSLLASRSSHLALPLHSNRLDSPQLASPRHPSLCPVPPAA
jgi:hypothetical protein